MSGYEMVLAVIGCVAGAVATIGIGALLVADRVIVPVEVAVGAIVVSQLIGSYFFPSSRFFRGHQGG